MQHKTTQQRVLRILSDQSGIIVEEIEPTHELQKNLRCDSLDIVEIIMHLEKEFGIHLIDAEFIELKTVQQVVNHIADIRAVKFEGSDGDLIRIAGMTGCAVEEERAV